jgi:signal transduction histidine kinase
VTTGGKGEGPRRRTVARRILASYLALLVAFALTMALGFRDMRAAADEAELLRTNIVPLQLQIGQALAEQNVLAAQLNHVTAAKNPGDVREWIETARRTRPLTFAAARKAAEGIPTGDPEAERLRADVIRELAALEDGTKGDRDAFGRLFETLAVGDKVGAAKLQAELVKREADTTSQLRSIKAHIETATERLIDRARARERRAIQLLLALSALTLLVGAALSIYARRVLKPLTAVTARAEAVARGDLSPREAVLDRSEIGELARTFEAMVVAIRDARTDLVKAERLATVGKMAARITHEIRNPLSAIGLNLELLEAELEQLGGDAKERRELVAAIKGEAQRLSRISEQYLSMARKPVPALSPESPGDLAREIVGFLRPELERANVRAKLEVAEDAPTVPLDENLFRQALLNLIRNAREAMSEGGEVTVRVAKGEDGGALVLVEDEGPGIPEDVRASVFDPFFTTKERGTGLGLAVTREIIEAHHGTIACAPRDGGGTRFVIRLPAEAKRD